MPKKPATFYVECPSIAVNSEETTDPPKQPQSPDLQFGGESPHLLPGEVAVAKAQGVVKYNLYTSHSSGIIGWLFCTNFKISFISSDSAVEEGEADRVKHSNKLIGQNDISLTNIVSVHLVKEKGEKLKTLNRSEINQSDFKGIRINTKDFATHWFSFTFTPSEDRKQIARAIGIHSTMETSSLLFATAYTEAKCCLAATVPSFPLNYFQTMDDWGDELKRLDATKFWRVTFLNEWFDLSHRLPRFIVLPMTVQDGDLKETANLFQDRCLPIWCYTFQGGFSLLRSTSHVKTIVRKEFGKRFYNKVSGCHPMGAKVGLKFYEVSDKLPSLHDLQISVEKLSIFCRPENLQEFWKHDGSTYTILENTKWLKYIGNFLKVAKDVTSTLMEQSVVLRERSGSDRSCIISSLVQIFLDPHYRTISGFQSLIQKEFIVMGHRFLTRLGFFSDKSEQSPIFLMFLDCVWQMMQQFPSSFQFTEYYLIALWDATLLGLFKEFLFDDDMSRQPKDNRPKRLSQPSFSAAAVQELPSIWSWEMQYHPEHIALFLNPLYQLAEQQCYQSQILMPDSGPQFVQVWASCYYRWLSAVQIDGGGAPAQYLQQCVVMEEIKELQKKLESVKLEENVETRNGAEHSVKIRPKSVRASNQPSLYFGERFMNGNSSSEKMTSIYVGSSFPFSKALHQKMDEVPLNDVYGNVQYAAEDTDTDD